MIPFEETTNGTTSHTIFGVRFLYDSSNALSMNGTAAVSYIYIVVKKCRAYSNIEEKWLCWAKTFIDKTPTRDTLFV
jgi:hypothetical protein